MINIEHIASLARLGLTEQEKKKFTKEIESILDFIAQLNEVSTEGIEPLSHAVGIKNVYRGDEILVAHRHSEAKADLVESAPLHEKGYVKVKAVLEK